jgi:hypothetical protein
MTRACALKGGEWLLEKGLAGKKINDLSLPDLEGFAAEVIGEFILQLAREGRISELEAVPVNDFTG